MKTLSIICLISLVLCSSNGKEAVQGNLVKIQIVSMRLDIATRSTLSFKQLWNHERDEDSFDTTLVEPSVLRAIDFELQQLQQSQPDTAFRKINTRIACLLYRSNGDVDSLSFSQGHVQYNGIIYEAHRPLYMLIADQLPTDHKELVVRYLNARDRIIRQEKLQNESTKDEK